MAGEPTFEPPINPSYPVKGRRSPKVLTVPFGDGYSERVRYGINTNPAQVTLTWVNITTAERDAIVEFLEARGGHEAFVYQPPGFSAAVKWVCPNWDDDLTDPNNWTVNVPLNQVFDP